MTSIIHGNSLEVLASIDADLFDSCVTDPPYELSFMSKKWDGTGIAFNIELWRAVYRVLKPGAYLFAFGGCRTYHRMACAIEDAGFEMRDSIHWIYGSGFPKSANISKHIDKSRGVSTKRSETGPGNVQCEFMVRGEKCPGHVLLNSQTGITFHVPQLSGADEVSQAWDGWGTALRPSHEPIVVARKPFKGTVAANVLAHGTGALNIDACRVPRGMVAERGESWARSGHSANPDADKIAAPPGDGINIHPLGGWPGNVVLTHDARCGDTCHPGCPVAVLGEQSGEGKSSGGIISGGKVQSFAKGKNAAYETAAHSDSGTAARYFNQSRWSEQDDPEWPGFFYCPKASTSEREAGCEKLPKRTAGELCDREDGSDGLTAFAGAGRSSEGGRANFHPTVKPLELMRWLCRLGTRKGGRILEPFLGSGTTAMAAILEGFDCTGIELMEEHVPIIKARVAWAERERKLNTAQLGLFEEK